MLVALLAGCSGKKTAETSADAKNAESTDEKNTLDFVDAHGERYTVETMKQLRRIRMIKHFL